MRRAKAEFGRRLLAWYDANRRDLPWRRTQDPYAIWISEVMLQQTTVATVVPRWAAFLGRFPDVRTLAGAPESDVVHEWVGLGYYSRARNLHKAAREIVTAHGGVVPTRRAVLRTLPGIGEYTAAAIASIAAGECVPLLDANVRRVMSRILALDDPADSATGTNATKTRLDRLIDEQRPGDFNQAMMELGALVCTPRDPNCDVCPVESMCAAGRAGTTARYPITKPRSAAVRVSEVAVIVRARRRWLWLQRESGGALARMWEVPRGMILSGESTESAASRILCESCGIEANARPLGLVVRHAVMNARITLHLTIAELPRPVEPRMATHSAHQWLTPEAARSLPMSSSQHRLIVRFGSSP